MTLHHSAERIANETWIILASRLMALVGVPVAGWLFLQVWNTSTDNNTKIIQLGGKMENVAAEQVQQSKRMDRIESYFFTPPTRPPR